MEREFLKRVRGSLTNFQTTKLGTNPLEKFLDKLGEGTTDQSNRTYDDVKPNNYIAIDKASNMCRGRFATNQPPRILIAEFNKTLTWSKLDQNSRTCQSTKAIIVSKILPSHRPFLYIKNGLNFVKFKSERFSGHFYFVEQVWFVGLFSPF